MKHFKWQHWNVYCFHGFGGWSFSFIQLHQVNNGLSNANKTHLIPTLFPIIHLSLNILHICLILTVNIYLQCAKNKPGFTAAKAFSLLRWKPMHFGIKCTNNKYHHTLLQIKEITHPLAYMRSLTVDTVSSTQCWLVLTQVGQVNKSAQH